MSSLFRAELLRLVSRRLLLLMLVCMAGLGAFGAAVYADGTREHSVAEQRDAARWWQEDKTLWEEQCADSPTTTECQEWQVADSVDAYLEPPSGFGEYTESVIEFGYPLMMLAVAIMAASLVGAEFSSGNISTQLLFTPGRIPLMMSKVVAATVGGLLVAFVYLGTVLAFCAIMFLSLRGANGMTAGIDLPVMLGRMVLLAALIAVMSAALAMGVGSTLITAVVFAVVFLCSYILSSTVSGFSPLQPFLPDNIFWAMAMGEHEVYGWNITTFEEWSLAWVINYDWALGYSLVGTTLIVVGTAWWFRRRDILG